MIRLLIFSLILLQSCKTTSKEPSLQNILTTHCYWDILDESVINLINSCYKFNGDGSCYYFYYNFYNKVRTDSVFRYSDDDVLVSNKWTIKGDSILIIRGISYKLITCSMESIILKHSDRNETLVLIKNCKTIHEKN